MMRCFFFFSIALLKHTPVSFVRKPIKVLEERSCQRFLHPSTVGHEEE